MNASWSTLEYLEVTNSRIMASVFAPSWGPLFVLQYFAIPSRTHNFKQFIVTSLLFSILFFSYLFPNVFYTIMTLNYLDFLQPFKSANSSNFELSLKVFLLVLSINKARTTIFTVMCVLPCKFVSNFYNFQVSLVGRLLLCLFHLRDAHW